MVDIGAARSTRGAAASAQDGSDIVIELRPADDVALSVYEAFCRQALHAPPQHPLWIRSWVMATGADVVLLTVRRHGRPAFVLALEIVKEGPFRIARFPGGRHANGNFIATERGAAPLSAVEARHMASALHEARPDVDLVFLERQNPHHQGAANPMTELASMRSPNVSLAVDLSGGFAEMLSRRNGKRKRKKHRLQQRKFEEAGGHSLIEAKTPQEAETLISAFYAMKAARFREKGIPNVFGPVEVQTFFRMLFSDALDIDPPPFVLHGLEVAGALRAVNGCSVTDKSVICEFGGICEGVANTSPGFFLDFACIEQACDEGKNIYDFSVGDEDYKRSWCDVETWQFDTLLPLNAKGRAAWGFEMARAHAVRLVKSNDALWSFVKQLRAKVAGSKPGDGEN